MGQTPRRAGRGAIIGERRFAGWCAVEVAAGREPGCLVPMCVYGGVRWGRGTDRPPARHWHSGPRPPSLSGRSWRADSFISGVDDEPRPDDEAAFFRRTMMRAGSYQAL